MITVGRCGLHFVTALEELCISECTRLMSLIKEIRERLDEIESERDQLQLKVRHQGWRLQSRYRSQTSAFVDESIVFGRVEDREGIVHLFRSDQSRAENGVMVVPIVGMGGLGKTTLAQLVYNDERIERHFELRAWDCASEDFDLIRITRAILESLTGSAYHLMNLDRLQVALAKKLEGKRFLLVVDNVWNVSSSDSDELRAPLMVGARGSGILVTTRSQIVSSIMGTVLPHFLQGLSDVDCWSLFEQRVFLQGNSNAHPNLAVIGKEIVKKCKGLLLAVKTLAGLLFSKLDEEEWIAILKSDIWDLPEERNGVLPTLRLSYHHLPSHLKQCYAFCSIFCKGHNFKEDVLVLLWMAEGFVQPKGNKQMEDIGSEYLADLVSRLPGSTTSLYNLQTLKLIDCSQLVELPSDLSNLVNLRHLPLGKEIGHGINELKDMINIRGEICISLLENVVNVDEVKEAELKSKRKLQKL
ncbi:hypothetical protein AAC387_Pa02g4575 [Persea americana]